MSKDTKVTLATEFEIRESIADIRAALQEGPFLPNIWGFYSPKNEKLISFLPYSLLRMVLGRFKNSTAQLSIQVYLPESKSDS